MFRHFGGHKCIQPKPYKTEDDSGTSEIGFRLCERFASSSFLYRHMYACRRGSAESAHHRFPS